MTDQWTFPAGAVDGTDSLKGYRVEGKDGHVGKVAWCDYAPGDSYLIVDVGLARRHHLVPAGAVASVDHDAKTVTLKVTAEQVRDPDPRGPRDRVHGGEAELSRPFRGRHAGGPRVHLAVLGRLIAGRAIPTRSWRAASRSRRARRG